MFCSRITHSQLWITNKFATFISFSFRFLLTLFAASCPLFIFLLLFLFPSFPVLRILKHCEHDGAKKRSILNRQATRASLALRCLRTMTTALEWICHGSKTGERTRGGARCTLGATLPQESLPLHGVHRRCWRSRTLGRPAVGGAVVKMKLIRIREQAKKLTQHLLA